MAAIRGRSQLVIGEKPWTDQVGVKGSKHEELGEAALFQRKGTKDGTWVEVG